MDDTANSRYYFKSLDFPGYWRIIWFGKLSRLNVSSDSVSIYVFIGKLAGIEKIEYTPSFEHKCVNLPIGQFPSLYIGAVLESGNLIPLEELPRSFHKSQNISLDLAKDKLTAFARTAKDDSGYLVPMGHQWDFYTTPQADSNLLGVYYNNNPYGIIIPCAEVLRFFYCYSSNIAKVMTSDRILNPGRWLYNLKESKFDEQTGIVTLKPRLAVNDLSRVFLACFVSGCFDINQAKQIPKQVAVISRNEQERPFVAFPPYNGPCTINASYHTHNSPLGTQIIITRIFSIDLPINFTAIASPDKCSGGKGTGHKKTRGWTKFVVKNPSDQAVRLNPGAINPALGTETNYDDDLGKRIPVFHDVAQIPTNRRDNVEGLGPNISTTIHPEGSTTDKGSSDSKLHKTIILPGGSRPNSGDNINAIAFDRIQSALQLIKSTPLAELSYLALTTEIQKSDDTDNAVIYNLPKCDHEESWAYIDKSKDLRRKIIIAKVVKNFETRYLIEFEQKNPGECSTLVVWNSDTDVPELDILAAVEECITNNASYLQSNSFEHSWSKLRHSWKKNEHLKPAHFLDRIFSAESLLKSL